MSSRTHKWLPPNHNHKCDGPRRIARRENFTVNILKKASEKQLKQCHFVIRDLDNYLNLDNINEDNAKGDKKPEYKMNDKVINQHKSNEDIVNEIISQKYPDPIKIVSQPSETSSKQYIKTKSSSKHSSYKITKKRSQLSLINTFLVNKDLNGEVNEGSYTPSIRETKKPVLAVSHSETFDSISSNEDEPDFYHQLFNYEYHVVENSKQLRNNPTLELLCYILTDDSHLKDDFIKYIDELKYKTFDIWGSYRIIAFDSKYNPRYEILKGPYDDNISESSIGEIDELEENELRMQSIKYRDSKIFNINKMAVNESIDPVVHCFEKLNKLIEDEVQNIKLSLAETKCEFAEYCDKLDLLSIDSFNPS